MKRIGIVSYNIYCNFTNYGSALQSWALNQVIAQLGYESIMVDYCPEILKDKDPLNPFKNMWDKDEESRRMCELTMPAIRENYVKFDLFYHQYFNRSKKAYDKENFNQIIEDERLDGFVCGADTIFCVDEFGVDDGYYANYECMKGRSISYAASFGDSHFTIDICRLLDERLKNFKAISIREGGMLPYISNRVTVPTQQVLDPTLLLPASAYEFLCRNEKNIPNEPYLLFYARRYNPKMEAYAIGLAKKHGWRIVEISLRAINVDKGHIMRYDAGVEEFLALTKNAQYVVTNSYHSMIFAIHFKRPFVIFSREQCDVKIETLSACLGLTENILCKGDEPVPPMPNYDNLLNRLNVLKDASLEFLKLSLELL